MIIVNSNSKITPMKLRCVQQLKR